MTSLTADTPGLYVVLSGDRSGHTVDPTRDLARELAHTLGLPLLARQTLLGALTSAMDAGDEQQAERLTAACTTALVAMAADCGGGVLDGVHTDEAALTRLDGQVVEVRCSSEGPAAGSPTSSSGQHGWPVVDVDASSPVDVDPLADAVVAAASNPEGEVSAVQWVVWRQDPAGGRVEVTRRDSEAVARSVAAAMGATAAGHTYVVTRAG
ncbi:MAG: hypothetical protein IPJ14_11145 [Kineosporiaceae bacterium]|nr:hypothetical protein [Kineosporiaceae bacterium]MBK7623182.1 hypothetical protein [Kineosporiaceae bacterium]MBK8074866.1 hypothetical protein [Kineosporiaceae bacterium]